MGEKKTTITKNTTESEELNDKIVANLQRQVNRNAQKESMVREWLSLKDLKINKDHLKNIVDRYGGYAYDIVKFTEQSPKRLINAVIKGREDEFANNPTVKAFLADNNSITSEKALKFFAENPLDKDVIADVLLKCDKDGSIRAALRAQEILSKHGIKISDEKESASQQQMTAALERSSHKKTTEGRMAAQATMGTPTKGGAEM